MNFCEMENDDWISFFSNCYSEDNDDGLCNLFGWLYDKRKIIMMGENYSKPSYIIIHNIHMNIYVSSNT